MIEIKGYPFPPSENSVYSHTGRFRFANKKLKDYQLACRVWNTINFPLVKTMREEVKEKKLSIQADFHFHYVGVYTKEGKVKKNDITNRIKCFLDCLCEMLQIDDSMVFCFTAIKSIAPSDKNQYVDVRIECL